MIWFVLACFWFIIAILWLTGTFRKKIGGNYVR